MTGAPLLAAAALLAASACAAATRDVTDDRGQTIAVPSPARRIAVLAPHLAEIAFSAGAGEHLVGVSSSSDVPRFADSLPVVANNGRIDFERLLRARPDVVLAWLSGNPQRQLDRLRDRGVPVVATEVRRLEDIPRLIRLAGEIAGTAQAAGRAAQALEREIAGLLPADAGRRPMVFIEVWHKPLMSVNGTHLISELVRICGGTNVFEDARPLVLVVSRERLLKAQPEVVIMNATPGDQLAALVRWQTQPLPAARLHQLYAVDPRVLHRQGPGLLEGARSLCADLRGARAALGGGAQ
jgi:iron complex transport system substrate-binding protein